MANGKWKIESRCKGALVTTTLARKLTSMNKPANSLRELLEQRVIATPNTDFLFSESDGRRFTYAEFDRSVDRAANMLASHGVRKGDVVSLLMPNSAEYIIAYFACWKLGALAGPVNSLLKAQEMAYVISNSEAKAIVIGSEFRERLEGIRKDLPHLRSVITFNDQAEATREFRDEEKGGRDVRAP